MLLSYIECYSQVSWIYDCIRDIHHESMITVGTKLQQQLSNTITRLAREENPMGLLFFQTGWPDLQPSVPLNHHNQPHVRETLACGI